MSKSKLIIRTISITIRITSISIVRCSRSIQLVSTIIITMPTISSRFRKSHLGIIKLEHSILIVEKRLSRT